MTRQTAFTKTAYRTLGNEIVEKQKGRLEYNVGAYIDEVDARSVDDQHDQETQPSRHRTGVPAKLELLVSAAGHALCWSS